MPTRFAVMTLVSLAGLVLTGIVEAQAPRRTLVIGMPVTPPNLPHIGVYVAKELGYFDEQGINVELTAFESGLQSLRGGVAGGLDIVGASSEPIITVISRGAKIRSIFSYAHRLTVVMAAQESIRRPADLRGKNLGIQDVGAFREVMTRAVLHSAGLTPQDVNYVPVASAGYIASLISNKIDTAILHIDQAYMARTKKASLHPLVPLWEIMPNYWYGTFSANEELLRKEPDLLSRAVAAMIRAHRFIYRNKERTLELASKHTGYPKEVLSPAYDALAAAKVWPVNDGMPAEMVDVTINKLVEIGLLKENEKPKAEQVVDRGPANAALARLGRWTDDAAWK
ncbi:MAG TPA: ABC transporter substrate-binding protein [Candidatus Binatia bacterium]|jgi:ABC-type nitrate/sulfonate/bicarbonate transport system substrate-binding protein|nr:ABC transporter substrate-binding protein [Candidatus Binatia bacterium]